MGRKGRAFLSLKWEALFIWINWGDVIMHLTLRFEAQLGAFLEQGPKVVLTERPLEMCAKFWSCVLSLVLCVSLFGWWCGLRLGASSLSKALNSKLEAVQEERNWILVFAHNIQAPLLVTVIYANTGLSNWWSFYLVAFIIQFMGIQLEINITVQTRSIYALNGIILWSAFPWDFNINKRTHAT